MVAFESVVFALRFGSPSTEYVATTNSDDSLSCAGTKIRYTQAVIGDYINQKAAKGRTKREIDVKLLDLERAVRRVVHQRED